MIKRRLFAILVIMMAVITVFAVPAKPGLKKKVKQADGSVVELTMYGDEHYSFYKDATGAPFQIVNGLAKKITPEEVATTWTARKRVNMNKRTANSRQAKRIGVPSTSTTGTHKGLVILLEFNDVKFSVPNVRETYQRVFNESGYNEEGMAGSVRDYFLKQSYDQLIIDFDVVGPFSTTYDLEHYGAPVIENGEEVRHDRNAPLAMKEAVEQAIQDPSLDFSDYDWDGDGEVDQVFIIFAGYSQAQGADPNSIWPHESHLKGYGHNLAGKDKNGQDVAIDTYGCASELMNDSGTEMDGIGTACHEFSHCLGLPDMYDTDYSGGYGMAYWDVMDAGSYLDNSRTPSGYTSYERWFSGWMEPIEIKEMTRINDMKPLATNKEAYILYNEGNRNEYYLLENRQPVDFDAKLFGHGLLILHVDYNKNVWESNQVNDIPNHQRLTIIPADNQLRAQYISDFEGDPWPGTAGNTMLTNFTAPAATVYNNNTDGTQFMNKAIDNITESEDGLISFVACRPELGIPANIETTELATGNSFTLSWPAVTGAVGYEIELTTIDKAASDPSEALLAEYDFSKCYSKTVGFTDVGTKLSDYGLRGWTGSKLFTTPQKLRIGTSSSTGYIQTPSWWLAPSSQQVTFVMGADVFTSGTSVKGTLKFESAKDGGTSADVVAENVEFEVTGNSKQVFSFTIPNQKDLFRLRISPQSQMYLNYFAHYDGIWTAEQLGINNTPALAPRRAAVITTYSSDTNSYTFANMNTNKRYVFRVRALGEENTYSQWSAEQTFEFGATAIMGVRTDGNAPVRYFDLSGREVDASARGVIIIKQGNTTKKVVR